MTKDELVERAIAAWASGELPDTSHFKAAVSEYIKTNIPEVVIPPRPDHHPYCDCDPCMHYFEVMKAKENKTAVVNIDDFCFETAVKDCVNILRDIQKNTYVMHPGVDATLEKHKAWLAKNGGIEALCEKACNDDVWDRLKYLEMLAEKSRDNRYLRIFEGDLESALDALSTYEREFTENSLDLDEVVEMFNMLDEKGLTDKTKLEKIIERKDLEELREISQKLENWIDENE